MMEGGSLSFQMSDKPETELMDEPYSLPENYIISTFISAPIIHSNGKTFKDSILIEIEGNLIIGDIFYSFQPDWGILDSNNRIVSKYTKPFYIKNSSDLYVWTFDHELLRQSPLVSSSFHKIENDYTIEISGKYNPQYTAGGDNGIIDGLHGDVDWRKGGWQGYQSQDFECVIDLKEVKQIQKIDATFLQDTRAWIFFPKQVEIYTSYDGKEYRPFGTQPITTFKSPSDNVDASIEKASSFTKPINCQFVKIIARNYGKLPAWHQGYGMEGDNAFIFIDEITIK
jgi:hypothetical protein